MNKKAFTIAEMIVALLIIGILATFLISNIGTKKFSEKENTILAFKTMESLDQAFAKIRSAETEACPSGKFITKIVGTDKYEYSLYNANKPATSEDVLNLLKNYLRFESDTINFCDAKYEKMQACSADRNSGKQILGAKLKDGVYFSIEVFDEPRDCTAVFLPSFNFEWYDVGRNVPKYNEKTKDFKDLKKCWAYISIDTNGIEPPNFLMKDFFLFDLDENGISKN